VEGILDFDVECVGQFVGKPPARCLIDKGVDGRDESAETGEPDSVVRPEAGVVEAGDFAEGIVAAAMGIAGEVIEKFELAEYGEAGAGAEDLFELRQGGDFVAEQVLAEQLRVKKDGSHNVIVPDGRLS
jgi:hypothetical protein